MIIQEEIYGNVATVYHRCGNAQETIKYLTSQEWESGGSAGKMYGDGLYTVFDFKDGGTSAAHNSGYGSQMVKFKVNGLQDYFVFNYDLYKKINPTTKATKDNYIETQEKKFGLKVGEFLNSKPNEKSYISFINKYAIRNHNSVKGIIFHGNHDGNVLIAFDPYTCIPVSYMTENVPRGEWKKVSDVSQEYKKDAINRGNSELKKASKNFLVDKKTGDKLYQGTVAGFEYSIGKVDRNVLSDFFDDDNLVQVFGCNGKTFVIGFDRYGRFAQCFEFQNSSVPISSNETKIKNQVPENLWKKAKLLNVRNEDAFNKKFFVKDIDLYKKVKKDIDANTRAYNKDRNEIIDSQKKFIADKKGRRGYVKEYNQDIAHFLKNPKNFGKVENLENKVKKTELLNFSFTFDHFATVSGRGSPIKQILAPDLSKLTDKEEGNNFVRNIFGREQDLRDFQKYYSDKYEPGRLKQRDKNWDWKQVQAALYEFNGRKIIISRNRDKTENKKNVLFYKDHFTQEWSKFFFDNDKDIENEFYVSKFKSKRSLCMALGNYEKQLITAAKNFNGEKYYERQKSKNNLNTSLTGKANNWLQSHQEVWPVINGKKIDIRVELNSARNGFDVYSNTFDSLDKAVKEQVARKLEKQFAGDLRKERIIYLQQHSKSTR